MTPNTQSDESVSVDEKRANYERFAMTVCRNGYVNVCNRSHNDDSSHTYSVETRRGSAVSCSCPHYQHRLAGTDDSCKHMIAVESNPLVISSATAAGTSQVATDGGTARDVSPCPGCGNLTADDTCGRAQCEGADEIDTTPL